MREGGSPCYLDLTGEGGRDSIEEQDRARPNRIEKEKCGMMKRDGIVVEGHRGTWYVISERMSKEGMIYLLEHETYGDEAPCVIVDGAYNILVDEVYNGFDDYFDRY